MQTAYSPLLSLLRITTLSTRSTNRIFRYSSPRFVSPVLSSSASVKNAKRFVSFAAAAAAVKLRVTIVDVKDFGLHVLYAAVG